MMSRTEPSARRNIAPAGSIAWANVRLYWVRIGTHEWLTAGVVRRSESRFFPLARVGPTTPKQFGAKHQTCPHLVVHLRPDRTWEMGAAHRGAAIRGPGVGDSPRGRETAEPLTSTPEPGSPPSRGFGPWQGPWSISDRPGRWLPSTRQRRLEEDAHSDRVLGGGSGAEDQSSGSRLAESPSITWTTHTPGETGRRSQHKGDRRLIGWPAVA